jgi:limonene-1,2-epoxide hydrolase
LNSEAVVLAFCQAWNDRNIDAVLGLLAEDVVYQNVPQPAMHGRKAAGRLLAPIVRETTGIEFIVSNIAVSKDGSTVLTERVDRLHYPGGTVDLPLMGVFVVRDGLIVEWRDYADSATVGREFSQAGVKLALDPE